MSSREVDAQLRTACARRDLTAVKLLLSQGSDVNFVGGGDWSTLHYAALAGDAEVVKVLIDAGAYLNARSQAPDGDKLTPLHCAAIGAYGLDTAIALINAGADVTFTDAKGRTPFDMPNGRAVREYYESRLAAKAISEAVASGPAVDGAITCKRGLSL